MIGYFSWRQPVTTNTVALQLREENGWKMQGLFSIKSATYYDFSSQLHFSPPGYPQKSLEVNYKQRLKPETQYYLDHELIGMIIKIHPLT